MQKEFNFTKDRLNKLTFHPTKDKEYVDTGQKGLRIRLRRGGDKKVFRWRGWDRVRKKRIQITLGSYPEMSISEAREAAAEYLHNANHGIDASEQLRIKREESIFDDLFNVWLETHAQENIIHWEEDKRRYEAHIKPYFGKKVVSSITPETIEDWRHKMLKKKKQRGDGTLSKGFVHRLFIIISSVYSIAAPRTWNPCSAVKGYKAQKRTVFLKSDHLKKFFEQLYDQSTPEYLRDFLLISLATGARRANVLAMRWGDIDLSLKVWVIQGDEVKGKEAMAIPLIDKTVEILERRKSSARSVFVFPSRKSRTGHLVEPKRAWKTFLKDAGLPTEYRLHDIRRTMGSWQAISGTSSDIIGRSLGHRSKQATEHYAHLTLDPVRAAMQGAYDKMEESRNLQEKVVKIYKKG